MEFELHGRKYVSVPAPGPENDDEGGWCHGCAFLEDEGCAETPSCSGLIFKRVNLASAVLHTPAHKSESAGQVAYGGGEQTLGDYIKRKSYDTATKLSNPKDSVGVRKAPLSCVPMNVVAEIGVGMLEGAVKGYGRHNYRVAGVRTSVYFDALMRHMMAFWEGEDIDPDTVDYDDAGNPIPGTGVHHVVKALTTLVVLRDAQMQGMCTDDRPPRSVKFLPTLNERAARLIDKHADKTPHHYTIADGPGAKG